jgi:hypothetical protein
VAATYELRSISPARLSRTLAWIFGTLLLIVCVVMIPAFMLAPFPENVDGEPPRSLFLVFLVLYPLFGALWAWICGQMIARVYNFVAKKKGGVTFEAGRLEGARDGARSRLTRRCSGRGHIKCSAAGGRASRAAGCRAPAC